MKNSKGFPTNGLFGFINMMNKIIHRGPYSAGQHIDGKAYMGFRRLSIIYLDNGSQPMYNDSTKQPAKSIHTKGKIAHAQQEIPAAPRKPHRSQPPVRETAADRTAHPDGRRRRICRRRGGLYAERPIPAHPAAGRHGRFPDRVGCHPAARRSAAAKMAIVRGLTAQGENRGAAA